MKCHICEQVRPDEEFDIVDAKEFYDETIKFYNPHDDCEMVLTKVFVCKVCNKRRKG